MGFDPSRPPATPRAAASVILLRARAGDGAAEVFLLRRHRKSSFMARSFVFPGGAVDEGEEDRLAAARELFEEAGVLLAAQAVDDATRAGLRQALADGGAFLDLLADAGLSLDLERLRPFSHWITPSAESKRFSARFFVAELPAGQTPSFDNVETVDEVWVTPEDAVARKAELLLPPPQLRTFQDLVQAGARDPEAVLALASARAAAIRPIVPRFVLEQDAPRGFALLLPWHPDYAERGQGEGEPFPADHPFASAEGRFVLQEDGSWTHD